MPPKNTPRALVYKALMSMTENDGYSTIVLDNMLKNSELTRIERSFTSALFYGVITRDMTLEYIISKYSKTPVKKLNTAVLTLLKCGLYQLKYMDNVPQSAAVNETVELAKSVGEQRAAGFINGILRSFERAGCTYPLPKDKLTATSIEYSVPMPLISLWRKAYGHEKAMEILAGLDSVPPLFIRVNTRKTTTEKLLALLQNEGVTATAHPQIHNCIVLTAHGGVTKLASFRNGLFHVQDGSSQLCATACGVKDGMRILDICSAPGGKSFTLAQLADNCEVLSCDLYEHRLELVREGATRLGLDNIKTLCNDATIYNPDLGVFDIILCDVVCSGFGIIRRKPEIKYKSLKTLDELPILQYNILINATKHLKKGGHLVYSTCTLNPVENEQVVERFLKENENFSLETAPTTIFPTVGGTDGFFYAVLSAR